MTPAGHPHLPNRHLFITDNLDLLRRLDNDSIALICIDPPFKKRKTFVGQVKPPLTDAELQTELDILAGWGINTPQQALIATSSLNMHIALDLHHISTIWPVRRGISYKSAADRRVRNPGQPASKDEPYRANVPAIAG